MINAPKFFSDTNNGKILSVLFLLFWWIGNSCICHPPIKFREAQLNEFMLSDHVVLADVYEISPDQKIVKLKIKEVFKGNYKTEQLIEISNNPYCIPFINIKGDWILYGKKEYGKLCLNECGISRSLKHPEKNRYFNQVLPPPNPDDTIKANAYKLLVEKIETEAKKIARDETQKELIRLRSFIRK